MMDYEKVMNIRINGIGNGFKVIDPADGYRKDNRLWFGDCSLCGDRVSNSFLSNRGVWTHSIHNRETGEVKYFDYCPATYES